MVTSALTSALRAGIALFSMLAVAYAGAAPVSEEERVPLDLRRTTLVVRDLERSLALYRDALGLVQIYDNMIRTPRSAKSDEEAERSLHLAFLRANDDFVGVLGLMEYRKPRKEQPLRDDMAFEPGTTVLVFNVQDLDERWEKVITAPGVTVLSEPEITQYPSYDGKGTIPVLVSVIRDADGFVLELNQLQVDELN